MTKSFVSFTTDKKIEAGYLCFLAKSISLFKYQDHGFCVLPYALLGSRLSVFFPNFPFSSDFWEGIAKCKNDDLGQPFPEICLTETTGYLNKAKRIGVKLEDERIIKSWKKVGGKFWRFGQDFLRLEKYLRKIEEITVLVTDYGTNGSFFVTKKTGKASVFATFRRDFPVSELARTLLLAFYQLKKHEDCFLRWYERKAVVDHLLAETKLGTLFPDYRYQKDLLDGKKSAEYIQESQKYLFKLGLDDRNSISIDQDSQIYVLGKTIVNHFSNQEKKVLKLLVTQTGRLVSYDQIAKTIWGGKSEEKFSLYALAKVIENIRRKLYQLNVHKNLIATVRGEGYVLSG